RRCGHPRARPSAALHRNGERSFAAARRAPWTRGRIDTAGLLRARRDRPRHSTARRLERRHLFSPGLHALKLADRLREALAAPAALPALEGDLLEERSKADVRAAVL